MKRFKSIFAVFAVCSLCIVQSQPSFAQTGAPRTFASPDKAVAALMEAVNRRQRQQVLAILGAGAETLIDSGDAVSDERERKRFAAAYAVKHVIQREGSDSAVLEVGEDSFPFPIPIVRVGQTWIFDVADGMQEIINRRIGRNELNTIKTMLAIADAQFEFANNRRSGRAVAEYAQKFVSSKGKQDGLYWPTRDDEAESPLGPLVANAVRVGYKPVAREAGEVTRAYHGYHFRMLFAQGGSAPGGNHPYVVQGKMIGGFAIIAYPATYGNSGVKTFAISHDRLIFEADLGVETRRIAEIIRVFDPTSIWSEVATDYQ